MSIHIGEPWLSRGTTVPTRTIPSTGPQLSQTGQSSLPRQHRPRRPLLQKTAVATAEATNLEHDKSPSPGRYRTAGALSRTMKKLAQSKLPSGQPGPGQGTKTATQEPSFLQPDLFLPDCISGFSYKEIWLTSWLTKNKPTIPPPEEYRPRQA